ncbi:hypothetical protein ColLi_03978 [Colletotrichum liriopes]|uniref:Uncharacterized protein n=1 Tax=Colletotrichum liriopes TaxID=708192 RepID=A0AA37GHQ1_9PEZI|nr:hypothetical protein ColLi_03978 [Colletotrichum liriopes]
MLSSVAASRRVPTILRHKLPDPPRLEENATRGYLGSHETVLDPHRDGVFDVERAPGGGVVAAKKVIVTAAKDTGTAGAAGQRTSPGTAPGSRTAQRTPARRERTQRAVPGCQIGRAAADDYSVPLGSRPARDGLDVAGSLAPDAP